MAPEQKLEQLRDILGSMGSVVIAYSGGADSSFLLHVASAVLKEKALAVTAFSPTYTGRERDQAMQFTASAGIAHCFIATEETNDERYSSNPPDRCYWCKQELFSRLKSIQYERGFNWIADGTNTDDHRDYRPGMRAACEFSVRSPLVEAGLAKEEIRALSRTMGLSTAERPSQPCLASRIPYGTPITIERLTMVERAEEILAGLGFTLCRVRHHETVARIEVPAEDLRRLLEDPVREAVISRFKNIGYRYVAVELQGYRTGSMNEAIGR
ncbi:MAG: TIGR00268 family protein [Spirochaetes bacterium RBG_13_51_14]|nr:MAG: TIGR00268 family protein [Spirochaetes bacterium RBG_13_51_14]